MKLLQKLFKKKNKTYPKDIQQKLLIINDDSRLIHEIFGITDKRAEELLEICSAQLTDNDHLHIALKNVVDKCKHTNEIVFSTLIVSKIVERMNEKDNLLQALLRHGM